jgi:hypothetical protein
MYPGQVSWLRSGTGFPVPSPSFPSVFAEWMFRTDLRLQWRDRTGIAPDFPFQPSRAPWVCNSCTTPVLYSFRSTWLLAEEARALLPFRQPAEEEAERAPKH